MSGIQRQPRCAKITIEYGVPQWICPLADRYILKASMPGVKPEEVEVTLQGNVLTIKGEAKEDKETQDVN